VIYLYIIAGNRSLMTSTIVISTEYIFLFFPCRTFLFEIVPESRKLLDNIYVGNCNIEQSTYIKVYYMNVFALIISLSQFIRR